MSTKSLTLSKNTAISVGLLLAIIPAVWFIAVAWARVEAQTERNTTDIQTTLEEVNKLNENLDLLNVNIERLNAKIDE